MLVQLVDFLRCPAGHAESPLVLAVDRWREGRGQVAAGRLGCPVCEATFQVRDNVVDFAAGTVEATAPVPWAGDGNEAAWRLAAQLDLLAPGRPVLLAGEYVALADELAAVAPVACLCLNTQPAPADAVSLCVAGGRLPLADGMLRGAAVGRGPGREYLGEVVRAVMDGGRVVAPADVSVPPGIEVLARDDAEWVGRVDGSGPLLQLRARRREG